MQLLDPTHPFFAPPWRRAVIVAVTLGWALFEFATGSPFWGVLFGALGVYCLYQFFIVFPPKDADDDET